MTHPSMSDSAEADFDAAAKLAEEWRDVDAKHLGGHDLWHEANLARAHLALSAKLAEAQWRSIETAPDDGSWILVFGGRHNTVRAIEADGKWWNGGCPLSARPTHWMPLPPVPHES